MALLPVPALPPGREGTDGSLGTDAQGLAAGSRARTVLVAEDQHAVRRLVRGALERAGFRVLEAEDGQAAVERHLANQGGIDLALFDLSMPRRNGLEALAAIRETEPGLPALLMSGHPDRGGDLDWPPDVPLLSKPFGPRVLVARVREMLGEGKGG